MSDLQFQADGTVDAGETLSLTKCVWSKLQMLTIRFDTAALSGLWFMLRSVQAETKLSLVHAASATCCF